MALLKVHKEISALPSTLEPDAIYMVRVGAGFDLYVTDTTGSIAYASNDYVPEVAPHNLSLGESYASEFRDHVKRLGAAINPSDAGHRIGKLIQDDLFRSASFVLFPSAVAEGKLYAQKPLGMAMDVSRASTGTRTNFDSLIELVPYNLAQYSQTFTNNAWGSLGYGNTAAIVADNTIAPDGSMTASKATFTAAGTQGRLVQAVSVTNGAEYTASFHVKYGNKSTINLYSDAAVFGTFVTFDFASNTITNSNNTYGSSVENVGNGWYRISFKYFAPSSTAQFGMITFGGEDGFVYLWGAQLVEGSTAKDYQKTETRLNIPRIDYAKGTTPAVLVEPQRTNNVFWSNDFSAAKSYNYQNATQSSTTILGPNGLPTTGITSDTSANIFHRFFKSVDASSATFTSSIYANRGDSRYLGLGVNHNGSASKENIVVFDLQEGVIASNPYGVDATIEDDGDGWFRCTHTFTYYGATAVDICVHNAGVGAFTTFGFQVFDSPSSATTLYVSQLQFEVGTYATSYIPTAGAAVTRVADVVTKTNAGSIIGQTEGTIFGEFEVIPEKQDSMLCLIGNIAGGWYSDFIYVRAYNGIPAVSVRQNDTTFVGIDGTTALSRGYHKFAFAYKQNDFAFYVDGQLIGTDNSGNVPACNAVYLGQYVDGADREVPKRSFALWKNRLPNEELAKRTAL